MLRSNYHKENTKSNADGKSSTKPKEVHKPPEKKKNHTDVIQKYSVDIGTIKETYDMQFIWYSADFNDGSYGKGRPGVL